MWVESAEGRKFVEEISKTIVAQIAPEELDMFDELMQEYFQNPKPTDRSAGAGDDPLGFGLGETLVAVAPAAAAMVSAVTTYITTEAVKAAQEETTAVVKQKIKALFNPGKADSDQKSKKEIAPLTKEQLEQVKRLARKQAVQFGIKPEQAEKMANALIGSLALV